MGYPYPPDLAPCDFFLFSLIKKALKGKVLETVDDAQDSVEGQRRYGLGKWLLGSDGWKAAKKLMENTAKN